MSTTPEAGAIVFRTDRGSVEILLVGALKDSTKWIFPKGHLNPSESHAAAALREAAEEAGITGIVTGLVGPTLLFQSGTESVAVEYYLVRMIEEEAALEERPRRWATVPEALALLSFEDARQLLRSAAKTLEQRLNSKEAPRFEELLLHEYDHVAQSFLNNEESGEKRVTFFITLCGAVGAALAFAVGRTAIGLPERLLIATTLAVLFVLPAIGTRTSCPGCVSTSYAPRMIRICGSCRSTRGSLIGETLERRGN
jgi:8-oxo-dGTP pyrophosphatase MutT (NUDIX family)